MKQTNFVQKTLTNCTFLSKPKRVVYIILLVFMYQVNINAQSTAYNWTEKIQLYGHGFSVPTDFTANEYEILANRFKIFTVEKRHAYADYGGSPSTERATIGTAAKIRAINPDVKVLLYWNAVMNYGTLYESNAEFNAHPEWVHSIWSTGYEIYDLRNIDCQNWWVNSVCTIIDTGNLDGVFFDAAPKVYVSDLSEAYFTAVDRVRDSIGENKIIIYNGYRVAGETTMQAGPDYIKHHSGVFIEFFLHDPLDTKEEAELLFDKLIDAYDDGKVIIPRGTPTHYLPGTKDPFLFNFASFLLFYGPNSYYLYNQNGYSKTDGMFDYYPEYYNIATGKSLGSPKRNGWVYTREFENISVRVDLENKTASITEKFQLSFKIKDASTNENLSDVTVIIDSQNYTTDILGETAVVLGEGSYNYSISKPGFETINQSVAFIGDTTIILQMLANTNNIQQRLMEQIKVYPNPGYDYLLIESPFNLKKINVYDQLGKLVQSKELDGTSCKLTISEFKEGIYLLKLEFEKEQTVSAKFSVEKK